MSLTVKTNAKGSGSIFCMIRYNNGKVNINKKKYREHKESRKKLEGEG